MVALPAILLANMECFARASAGSCRLLRLERTGWLRVTVYCGGSVETEGQKWSP